MYDDNKKNEKGNKTIYILFIIIAILISLLLYFIFLNKDKRECDKCNVPIENQDKYLYQLINYSNFSFKMPIDWKFVDDSDEYGITNTDNSIFISFEVIDTSFSTFASDDFQISYLENIQTNNNIKINQLKKFENYYLYEGTFNDYDYLIIGKGNEKRTILIKTTFLDKVSYNKHKDNVIAFALSD